MIGKMLDLSSLGIYNIAQKVVMVFPQALTSALDQVTYPIYSRMQEDAQSIQSSYWRTLELCTMLALPVISILFLISYPIVPLLFGAKWIISAHICRILCIFSVSQCIGGGIFASIIYASGKPKWTTIMNVFRILTLPVFVIAGSKWGLLGIAWGFSIWGIIGRFFNQYILKLQFGYSILKYCKITALPLATNIICTALLYYTSSALWPAPALSEGILPSVIWIAVWSVIWIALYITVCRLFMRSSFDNAVGILHSSLFSYNRGHSSEYAHSIDKRPTKLL